MRIAPIYGEAAAEYIGQQLVQTFDWQKEHPEPKDSEDVLLTPRRIEEDVLSAMTAELNTKMRGHGNVPSYPIPAIIRELRQMISAERLLESNEIVNEERGGEPLEFKRPQ